MKLNVRTSIVFSSAILVAATLFLTSDVKAQLAFSAQTLNPTGDPIGGGAGYSDVYAASEAQWVVGTKNELLAALGSAVAGDVIFVEDGVEIDLTGEANLVIPGGVTLAGGRGANGSSGALLFSNSWFVQSDLTAVFVTGGPDVRITGLRFRGPSADVLDHDYDATGVANGVRAMHTGLEVDNSEFFAWDKWAIWLYISDQAHIHHNDIHHNRRNGYGYGVWVGGAGSESGAYTLIEANLFDFNRHHIASSAHDNTWEARYNIMMEHGLQEALDRHSNNAGGGGRSTIIHHNLFLNDDTRAFASPGYPSEEFRIYNNWFIHENEERAIRIKPDVTNANIYDNSYGGVDASLLPTAVAAASQTEGTVPLTVHFDATGSFDPSGADIARYEWRFGDGVQALDGRGEGSTVSYTFSEPGLYQVEVRAFNEYGVPGRAVLPILVKPAPNAHLLSAWLKDTYIGPLTGYYRKQVLVDGDVVWEDDVAADEGWQHVLVDVSDRAAGKSSVEVGFRVLVDAPIDDPNNQIVELHVYVDDVHLFGGEVANGTFEEQGSWRFSADGSWSSGYESEDVRSGHLDFRLRNTYLRPKAAGEWVMIYQSVPVHELEAEDPTTAVQRVELQSGWNMVSLHVKPSDASFEAILSPILSSVIVVEDDEGAVYDPQNGTNTIGQWDISRAYLINVGSSTSLSVEGTLIEPEVSSLALAEGWNLVPYYPTEPTAVGEALTSINSDVVLLKDETGNVYYPEYGIDTVGQLQPGRGYKLFLRTPATLTYPGN